MSHAVRAAALLAALIVVPFLLEAQQPTGPAVDSLHAAVGHLAARLDSLEAGACPTGPAVVLPARAGQPSSLDSLAEAVEQLRDRVERAISARCGPGAAQPTPTAAAADTGKDELAALRAAAAAAAGGAAAGAAPADTTGAKPAPAPAAAAPSGPRGQNLLNPEISATGDIRLNVQDQGPQRDNAVAREFEFAFQSDLDPYSKTKIFLTFEQEEVGVEEGYIYWTGLPGHIRLDVGKFRQQVGDLNRWHLHALPETEYPLVYQRFLGQEGLAAVGVSLYTALPFSIAGGTHEVFVQATTAESQPLYENSHQPTLLGRFQNFWQLSRSTYAQLGFTATGGNNSDLDLQSRLLGLDFRLTYRPPSAGTRKDITFRAEGYRLHASEAGIETNRYGAFLDLQARLSQRWILGGRYDYSQSPRGPQDTQWSLIPAITWWQSEFVFLRLQGQHLNDELTGNQNLLSFQVVWAMGPHKHETY
jgi:hypothetical protein